MRYHNTHQPPNVYNENKASRSTGQSYILGGHRSLEEGAFKPKYIKAQMLNALMVLYECNKYNFATK